MLTRNLLYLFAITLLFIWFTGFILFNANPYIHLAFVASIIVMITGALQSVKHVRHIYKPSNTSNHSA